MTLVRWILLGLALVWGAALVIAPGATVIVSLLYLDPIAMTLTAIWLIVWVPTLLRDGNPALLAVVGLFAVDMSAEAALQLPSSSSRSIPLVSAPEIHLFSIRSHPHLSSHCKTHSN